jgi:Domain of unknown function (DUF1963)
MRFLTKLLAGLSGKAAAPRGKTGPDQAGIRQGAADALAAAEAEAPLWAAMERARLAPPLSARLVLQVPVPAHARDDTGNRRSWIGGAPRLPKDVGWPQSDGRDMVFVAQIACAALPPGLWGGLGPRQGWLVVFLCPRTERPRVIHTMQAGVQHPEPALQPRVWFQPFRGDLARPVPAAWPVDVVEVAAGQAAVVRHVMNAEGGLPVHDAARLLLDDPAYGPFDAVTVRAFLQAVRMDMEDGLTQWQKIKPSKPADAETNAAMAAATAAELEKLAGLESALALPAGDAALDPDRVLVFRTGMQGVIKHYGIRCQPDDPEIEQRSFRAAQSPILSYHPQPIWRRYLPVVERRLANLHATGASLTAAQAAVWVPFWAHVAANEAAAMGHVPAEDPGVPVGPGTGRLALLELPSSAHFDWNWGDLHNIVLSIPESDLAQGRFDRVERHITT